MDYQLRQDYFREPEAREAFKDYLKTIFGLDLTLWEEAGYWDYDNFLPFSFFDLSGNVVSSLCLYCMDLVVEGHPVQGAQFAGVGTLPELRRQGLSRQLTDLALQWIFDQSYQAFLFANDSALDYYDACGFKPVSESQPFIKVKGRANYRKDLKKLDLSKEKDLKVVEDFADKRVPVSRLLGAKCKKLFMLNTLYYLKDHLYIAHELETLLAFRKKGDKILLYDVVAENMPSFEQIEPFIIDADIEEVSFYFEPDLLKAHRIERRPLPENYMYLYGDTPLFQKEHLFPFTAHS